MLYIKLLKGVKYKPLVESLLLCLTLLLCKDSLILSLCPPRPPPQPAFYFSVTPPPCLHQY